VKISKKKHDAIKKALDDGSIKRLGKSSYSVPSSFFVMGVTPGMVAQIDKEWLYDDQQEIR
jgi:hypothetical protein